eukprot:PhM_4_TR9635/c0_g3_i1/m.38221/K08073/PNKP; bifunctional polynucleotide phosphatase/kinase
MPTKKVLQQQPEKRLSERQEEGECNAAAAAPGNLSAAALGMCTSDADRWMWYDTTVMYYETPSTCPPMPSTKIAAFDYDGCLAKTSLFKKGPDAWSLLFGDKTTTALRLLHEAGYKLVIMSNQSTIGKATNSRPKEIAEKKARFVGFVEKTGLPFQVMAATASVKNADKYRKPGTGMWEFLETAANGGISVDRAKSFYVGDAAGRKKDHSDSDKKFAEAVGVTFFTEDVFFKDEAYKTLL